MKKGEIKIYCGNKVFNVMIETMAGAKKQVSIEHRSINQLKVTAS